MGRRDTERDETWMRSRQLHSKPAYKIHTREKPHGTRYSYVMGCHCQDCLRANREYGRVYRATKRGGRATHPGNCRMRQPKEFGLEQRKSLTVDSVVIIQRKVLLYAV